MRKGGITKATWTQDGHCTKELRNNSTGSHDGHIDCTLVYRSMYIKAFAKAMLSKTTVLRLSSSQWCSISLRGPRPFEDHPHIHLSLRRFARC